MHRLGQLKDVFVHRLVIANTVEDRILAIQDRKKNLADGSLGEGTGKKIGRKFALRIRPLLIPHGVWRVARSPMLTCFGTYRFERERAREFIRFERSRRGARRRLDEGRCLKSRSQVRTEVYPCVHLDKPLQYFPISQPNSPHSMGLSLDYCVCSEAPIISSHTLAFCLARPHWCCELSVAQRLAIRSYSNMLAPPVLPYSCAFPASLDFHFLGRPFHAHRSAGRVEYHRKPIALHSLIFLLLPCSLVILRNCLSLYIHIFVYALCKCLRTSFRVVFVAMIMLLLLVHCCMSFAFFAAMLCILFHHLALPWLSGCLAESQSSTSRLNTTLWL